MNLDTASEEMRAQILEAREEIIFNQSWVADGMSGRIRDKDGNIKEELPQFSELFSADWDMPSWHSQETKINTGVGIPRLNASSRGDVDTIFDDSVWLTTPPANMNSTPFCKFDTTGFKGTAYEYSYKSVFTTGIYQNPGATGYYNVGYSNYYTGASLASTTNLSNAECCEINPPRGITLGVRASTNSTIGSWQMFVTAQRA